jgi:hypothetical protein
MSWRRRKCVSAAWAALLESPVASAIVRTLALTGPFVSCNLAVKMQINQVGGRLLVVAN